MGDAADDVAWGWWCLPSAKRPFQSRTGRGMWRTAGGSVVPMAGMDVAHLRAAIRECEARENPGKKADLETALENKTRAFFSPLDDL